MNLGGEILGVVAGHVQLLVLPGYHIIHMFCLPFYSFCLTNLSRKQEKSLRSVTMKDVDITQNWINLQKVTEEENYPKLILTKLLKLLLQSSKDNISIMFNIIITEKDSMN